MVTTKIKSYDLHVDEMIKSNMITFNIAITLYNWIYEYLYIYICQIYSYIKVYTNIILDWFDFSHILSSGIKCASIHTKKKLLLGLFFFFTCTMWALFNIIPFLIYMSMTMHVSFIYKIVAAHWHDLYSIFFFLFNTRQKKHCNKREEEAIDGERKCVFDFLFAIYQYLLTNHIDWRLFFSFLSY